GKTSPQKSVWKRRASSNSFRIGGKSIKALRENDALGQTQNYDPQLSGNIGIQNESEKEARLAQEKEHSDLMTFVFREFGRPVCAVLAEYNSDSKVTRSEVLTASIEYKWEGMSGTGEVPLYGSKKSSASMLLTGEIRDVDQSGNCEDFERWIDRGVKRIKSVASIIPTDRKGFQAPIAVKISRNNIPINVAIPAEASQADQGSDMIVVTIGFLRQSFGNIIKTAFG
ncbi:hypothetical protein OnM2_051011, partial [Erysiphe neolycopersici]